jgi:inhibitor of cysteine peptidase
MLKILVTFFFITINNQCESAQTEMIITNDANGQEVTLSISDEFFIELEGNPTTGYTWSINQMESSMLSQIGDAEFQPESPKMGAPGRQIFHFKCEQTGTTELHLIYHRPWEKDTAPADSFYVTVVIDN